ncbi:MAG: hypothetical protein O3A46_05400 [Candidatus Poribacteria bacterium]|nr:hypothetical protein [Candidatus Poribacteria bacterium]
MRLEDKLAKLRLYGVAPITDSLLGELRKFLPDKNSLVVAKAALMVGERNLVALTPDLATAFARLIDLPAKADESCVAKNALIDALDALGSDDEALFRRGIRHRQVEPAYGGSVDTAAALRAKCAYALARVADADVLFDLTTLLADSEPDARLGAIRALAYYGGPESELLLRFKASATADDPNVIGECFSGLMRANPSRSLDFVADYLPHRDRDLSNAAAYALGESREIAAFERLRDHREDSVVLGSEGHRALLLAIALTRRNEAIHYLIEVVGKEPTERAVAALEALRIYAGDDSVSEKARRTVATRGDAVIVKAYAESFASEA